MKSILLAKLAIITACLVFSTTAFADVKIKSRQTMSGQTTEVTTYIKGKRQRTEQNVSSMQMINLTQCDLKRGVQLNPQAQAYIINSWAQDERAQDESEPSAVKTSGNVKTEIKKGGVINTTITTKDTGETKKMFGYLAHHLIVTTESESTPEACTQMKTKIMTDGWYIDAAFQLDCDYQSMSTMYRGSKSGGCQDKYNVKQVGTAKRGYPVYEKTMMYDETGKETFTMINEVVELSNANLDAALFEIPDGWHEAKDASAMYASMASKATMSDANQNSGQVSSNQNSGLGSTISTMNSQKSDRISSEVGAKKEGVVRIGVPMVKVTGVGDGLNANDLAAAIQNTLGEYLKGSKVELVALGAKLSSAIDTEAKEKECDYVLYATAAHKKGGGGGFGGMFGKTLGSYVAQTGIGHTGSMVGNVAGQIATQSIVAATLTSNVKSKDELSLDVKLQSAKDASAVFAKQYKQKAKSDGEDIISPVIEQLAQAIILAAGK